MQKLLHLATSPESYEWIEHLQVNAAMMVKNLPPRLRELLKLRVGPGANVFAGPSSRALGKTISAVAADGDHKGGFSRARTEDGSRLRGMPVDIKQPLLEHQNGPDSPRSL